MRVPWAKFRIAYAEYPRRQALALWVHAIAATQQEIPARLLVDLQKRCPGFVEHGMPSGDPKLVALHLLQWIHNEEFGYAKRQGWLDALIFYGVRHLRSESAWAHFELCDREWTMGQPSAFPTFDRWWRQAQERVLCDKFSYGDAGKAIEKYLDWEALVAWLRPLVAPNGNLPPDVTAELERRCPGILGGKNSCTVQSHRRKFEMWQLLRVWRNEHCLSEAREAGWVDCLLQRIRFHPWHVRISVYGRFWAIERSRKRRQPYPSFDQWREAAHRYVIARSK